MGGECRGSLAHVFAALVELPPPLPVCRGRRLKMRSSFRRFLEPFIELASENVRPHAYVVALEGASLLFQERLFV